MDEDLAHRKLVAFLHDPPEKPYDYGPVHHERAKQYLATILGQDLGVLEQGGVLKREPDWEAAAADRFPFPDGKKLNQAGLRSLSGGLAYKHPFTGKTVLEEAKFPQEDQAWEAINSVLPNFEDATNADRFWALWRLWRQYVMEKNWPLGYLPADTRIPDGTIWHHMAVVSGFESTRSNWEASCQPAFFLLQIGPVQEFIAQARTTRDLWSGSYLLSWMIAKVAYELAERYGPDTVIYPSLWGQPLYDWLNRERLQQLSYGRRNSWEALKLDEKEKQGLVTVPNFPNKILALVPQDFCPKELLEKIFSYDQKDSEWRKICDACWEFLNANGLLSPNDQEKKRLWESQCKKFWQRSWQVWPWQDVPTTLNLWKQLPRSDTDQSPDLELGREIARKIPEDHLDHRLYRNGELSKGWAWSAHYELLSHRLDARRQTREFDAWEGTDGFPKDALSGKEEAILDRDWMSKAQAHQELKDLFRKKEELLGAPNAIKRVWHKAYLQEQAKLDQARESFKSVPAVAATAWVNKVLKKELTQSALKEKLEEFRKRLHELHLPLTRWASSDCELEEWLKKVDLSCFYESCIREEWEELPEGKKEKGKLESTLSALRKLFQVKTANGKELGAPSAYYAILYFDGDSIGQWVRGSKAPKIKDLISEAARNYFENPKYFGLLQERLRSWLDSPRPVSPSYHLQLSEALANFALHAVRPIVEKAHHGQLIFAGGDDVLAMLPAEEALACALGLCLAFQGKSQELAKAYRDFFVSQLQDGRQVPEGLLCPREGGWPLLVLGQATASVGVCIGHIREALQDTVEESRTALQRAKREYDRNAIALTLFKRSGEILSWGVRFDSCAFKLRESFLRHLEPEDQTQPCISQRFAHRLAELLLPLAEKRACEVLDGEVTVADLALAEASWVIEQQTSVSSTACREKLSDFRRQFLEECRQYLDELKQKKRCIKDFVNLFALEAFLRRRS